jgi:membrane fusion protein (multidrug efflux system)
MTMTRATPGDLLGAGAARWAGAGLLGLALLCGPYGCSRKEQAAFSMPPMPVETSRVERTAVADRFHAVGSIDAGDAITVVSEIDGVVSSLPFREGHAIARGGLIAQLDDKELSATVMRAGALLAQRQAAYDRVKMVVDQGAAAPQELDDAAATLKVAQAELSLAQQRLSKTRITAPFQGLVGARRVSPGAFVRAGEAITDLAQIRELRVSFSAPERYLSELRVGAPITVSTIAYPGRELSGRIDVIEPVLDAATRSARIVARVTNPDELFRPGMSATVSAVLSERPSAITIPSEAVFAEGSQAFVYVVRDDSTVARSPVTLGTRFSDAVEVVQGLESGARVVRAGHQKLFDGSKVVPVESRGAASADTSGAAKAAGGADSPAASTR